MVHNRNEGIVTGDDLYQCDNVEEFNAGRRGFGRVPEPMKLCQGEKKMRAQRRAAFQNTHTNSQAGSGRKPGWVELFTG